ncbi:hypothetical protein GCM10017056_39970 [Seohaeicola zhoushanensis]|uniref:Uncharacterized protein n=1 Tax=Seohaeicola zhoushanensis TaxID=1569283 RepID=A0A8J3M928_9RHOB|nr:hypothetical protein GCM10017056_39970 [Seohaeicola zhoushanensis]
MGIHDVHVLEPETIGVRLEVVEPPAFESPRAEIEDHDVAALGYEIMRDP